MGSPIYNWLQRLQIIAYDILVGTSKRRSELVFLTIGDVREIDDISARFTTRSFKAVIPVGDLWPYQIGYVPVSMPCRNKR